MYINKRGLREIGNVLFKKPTVGRLVTTAWVAPIYVGLRQTAATFRALDEVLYPEYRDQKVERPVFVFANPRSGTTLTHRLISMDDEGLHHGEALPDDFSVGHRNQDLQTANRARPDQRRLGAEPAHTTSSTAPSRAVGRTSTI